MCWLSWNLGTLTSCASLDRLAQELLYLLIIEYITNLALHSHHSCSLPSLCIWHGDFCPTPGLTWRTSIPQCCLEQPADELESPWSPLIFVSLTVFLSSGTRGPYKRIFSSFSLILQILTQHVGFVCGRLSADKGTYSAAVHLNFNTSIKCNRW